jgi:hypothetical protein
MNDENKKAVWPWIVALLIGLPVLYVASYGPACWLIHNVKLPGPVLDLLAVVYSPFSWWQVTFDFALWYEALLIDRSLPSVN